MNSGKDLKCNNIFLEIQLLNTLKFGVLTKLQMDMCIMISIKMLLHTMMSLQQLKFFIFYPGFQLSINKFSTKVAKDLQKAFTNGGAIETLLLKKLQKKVMFTQ